VAIRDYRPEDAQDLAALYVRSVRELGARDYSPEQIEVWAGLAPSAERLDALMADGRIRLVFAGSRNEPLGFADLEPDGHIHFLYCAPEAASTGAAGALLDEAERRACSAGVSRLYVEASERAKGLFLKHGYTVQERRDFEVNGVPIHNWAMEKRL
jgi:putative acetyltransferase